MAEGTPPQCKLLIVCVISWGFGLGGIPDGCLALFVSLPSLVVEPTGGQPWRQFFPPPVATVVCTPPRISSPRLATLEMKTAFSGCS